MPSARRAQLLRLSEFPDTRIRRVMPFRDSWQLSFLQTAKLDFHSIPLSLHYISQ